MWWMPLEPACATGVSLVLLAIRTPIWLTQTLPRHAIPFNALIGYYTPGTREHLQDQNTTLSSIVPIHCTMLLAISWCTVESMFFFASSLPTLATTRSSADNSPSSATCTIHHAIMCHRLVAIQCAAALVTPALSMMTRIMRWSDVCRVYMLASPVQRCGVPLLRTSRCIASGPPACPPWSSCASQTSAA